MTHIYKGQFKKKKNSTEGYIFLPHHYHRLHNKDAWDIEVAQFIGSKCGYTCIYPTLNGMDNYPEPGASTSQQGFCTKRDISK